jgi:hypothetical protein
MKAHAHLGRKQSRIERNLRGAKLRLCVVCGDMKPPLEFQASKRRRVLNIFCNECKKNPSAVKEALSVPRLKPRVPRRDVLLFFRRLAERRIARGKEVKNRMSAEEFALKAAKLPERVAAIVGKTYAEMGDAATLADDEAVMMIRDLLLELDDTLIKRNKHKRLARR